MVHSYIRLTSNKPNRSHSAKGLTFLSRHTHHDGLGTTWVMSKSVNKANSEDTTQSFLIVLIN